MDKSYDHMLALLVAIRDGRVNSNLLDAVYVNCYGDRMLLKHLAFVSIRGQALVIEPYDKDILSNIERALYNADLGLVPQRGATSLLVNIPRLYDDQRQRLVKHAKKITEAAKVSIRNIRRRAIKEGLNKKDVEELTKSYIKKIDHDFAEKKKRLTSY